MKKALTFFLMLCVTPLCAFPAVASAPELTVSAAISLKNAFEEIGKLYQGKYAVKVLFNFGAFGDLVRQIEAGG